MHYVSLEDKTPNNLNTNRIKIKSRIKLFIFVNMLKATKVKKSNSIYFPFMDYVKIHKIGFLKNFN